MNSKVNKCSGGIRRSEKRINSQIIASRDEVEQYATNIDHQRVGFSTPRSRYHLPPTSKSHFVERDNSDKKIKDTAKHFVWIVVSFLTLSIILHFLIINHGIKRKMLREPDKSKIVVERDVDRTPKPYNVMFQFERAHWINNGPEIDDLMEISQMLSDKEVSATDTDLRKAIAIMHTKVNRYDEFTDKCNFVLTSMREVYEDAEDFKWICSDNSSTQANLDWYLSKERAHWINNGPEKDNLMGIARMLSDKNVSATDIRKAIAIMPTEVFPKVHNSRYDEFAEKCNYVLTSMAYLPAESEKTSRDIDSVSRYWEYLHHADNFILWICGDNSLTATK